VTRPASVHAHGWGWRHAGRRAWAVSGLDLRVEAGQRVLLLGASGSGKSTLIAGLAGLLHTQDSGESVGSLTIDDCPTHEARHRSGLVLQDPETQLVMSRAGDDVAFGPENYGVARAEIWSRVDEALETVGFRYGRQRLTSALSGGEKQRLALAGVLANRPGLLLLDEPTANLDPMGADLVRSAVVRTLDRTGASLILVEHRVEQWLPFVDRVVVLAAGGGLLADGSAQEVFAAHGAQLRRAGVWLPGELRQHRAVPSTVASGPALIAAAQLRLRYRGADRDAVAGVDLDLGAGVTTAVVGPNGSGKSSLAGMLAGLVKPTAGRVWAADRPDRALHRRSPRSLAGVVGTVFQNPEHQFLTSTVRAELLLAPRRLGWSAARADTRADELLDRLGLTALAPANPFTLSGGQKRRLSVATALSAAAGVLVLDEPTFGQDARTWTELVALLSEVRNEGCGLLVVSHDEDFVARLADRVLTMTDGTLE
jgi:energy-coupling factor transporter ATP-binding protein EcfA2